MVRWVVGSILRGWCGGWGGGGGCGPIELFLVLARVLHDWCNKGRSMCNNVCGMVHIKEPLLLIEIVVHVVAAGFLSHYLCDYHMSDAI